MPAASEPIVHSAYPTSSGAKCTCGREFNIWRWRASATKSTHTARFLNLARAQAARHAATANRRNYPNAAASR